MSTSSTLSPRPRGRPRKFDEEAVLDALTSLFWEKGYEATTLSDIVEVSGLNKPSLYNCFGSKQQLFKRVLSRYIDLRLQAMSEMLEASKDMAGLHSFIDAMREFGARGCLAVNTSAELGACDQDIVVFGQLYRERIRTSLYKAIAHITQQSRLAEDVTEARTDMLLAFLIGFAVIMRGGADGVEIDRFVRAAHVMVDVWDSAV